MSPNKLITRSRAVGGKKRHRLSKNQSPTSTPTEIAKTTSDSSVAVADTQKSRARITITKPRLAINSAQSYTGLSQVGNTLKFPPFDPNTYFSTDLFKDSSPLKRTTEEEADTRVQSIEEKRQTVRIATANIQLNQDIVKAGNEYLKLEGLAIDYATTGIKNETKFVNYQIAGINQEIALNQLDEAKERLAQGFTLAEMQSIILGMSQEWEARESLKLSQISRLKIESTKAKKALNPQIRQLSQNFRQELEELN